MALDPLVLRYDNTAGHAQSGTLGQAPLDYQFGFTQSPRLKIAEGYLSTPTRRNNNDVSARSGIRITSDLRAAFNWAYRTSENITSVSTGTVEQNQLWLGGKGSDPATYPMPEVTVDWGGLEKIGFVGRVAQSMSLQSGLVNKVRANWTGNSSNVQSRDYTRQWNPLAGANITWKGNIETQLRYNSSVTFTADVRQGTKSRQTDDQITAQVSYSIRTGFKLPLLFMRSLNLQNQTTISLNGDYRSQRQERNERAFSDQYAVQAQTSSWSLSPRLTYSFSNTVQGQAYVQLQQTKNDVTDSKSRLFEFGIQVNIAIRG